MKPYCFPLVRRWAFLLAALTLALRPATAQSAYEPRHVIRAEDITPWHCAYWWTNEGSPIDVVGDVDGDGFDDLVCGIPRSGAGNCTYANGAVTVVSGADGSAIWSVAGQIEQGQGWFLGWAVCGIGDVNGDRVPDVAASATHARHETAGYGKVFVYSGADGTVLRTHVNPSSVWAHAFGFSLSRIEDLDLDGIDDFIVGSPSASTGARVFVFSGGSGALLHTFSTPDPDGLDQERFGDAVADAGDIDGDGVHDILVGEPNARNADGVVVGIVYAYSGASGALMHAIVGPASGAFGSQLDGVGDQNGDGRDDYLIGNGYAYQPGQVISGMDPSVVLWSAGTATSVSGAGDVDGDGIEDMLIGFAGYNNQQGYALLIAGGRFASLHRFYEPNGHWLGGRLSRAGDVNRDGFADFVVAETGKRQAYVYLGRPASAQIRRIDGGAANDNLGSAVNGAGDVDGDGFDDVIVGAQLDDSAAGSDAGSARVVSGYDGRVLLTCEGGASGDRLGRSVDGAGDVNGDGFDDVIVGAPNSDATGINAGSARILSGRNGSELLRVDGSAAGDALGLSVAGAGDVNGDGYADVIVGAPYADRSALVDAGSATVFSGRDQATLYELTGAAAGGYFGYSVSGAGDVDGDGLDDLVVGAPWSDANGADSGSVTVFSGWGGTPLFTVAGNASGDFFGFCVSAAGDVNKDGFGDVIVGVNRANHAVTVRVFAGPAGDLLYELSLDPAGDSTASISFGTSVSGAGDVNGDGYADLIVGARWATVPQTNQSGVARVYSGFDGGVLMQQLAGDEDGAEFGISVAGAGDVNGDGRDDVVVGAHLRDSEGLTGSGSAFVYSLGYPGDAPRRRVPRAPIVKP